MCFFCGFNTQEGEQLVNDWLGWLGLFSLLFGVEVGSWSGWDVVGMGLFVFPHVYIYIFLIFKLFIHVYIFWMHFSLYGKINFIIVCLLLFQDWTWNHAVILRLLIISPFAWVNTCFELVSLVAGCIKSTHDPAIPFLLAKQCWTWVLLLKPGESPSTKYLQILLLESLWNFTCSWLTHHGSCLTFHFYWLTSHFYW